MKTQEIWLENKLTKWSNFQKEQFSEVSIKIFGESICYTTTNNPEKNYNGEYENKGSMTDIASLNCAHQLGFPYENYRPSEKIIKVAIIFHILGLPIQLCQQKNNCSCEGR